MAKQYPAIISGVMEQSSRKYILKFVKNRQKVFVVFEFWISFSLPSTGDLSISLDFSDLLLKPRRTRREIRWRQASLVCHDVGFLHLRQDDKKLLLLRVVRKAGRKKWPLLQDEEVAHAKNRLNVMLHLWRARSIESEPILKGILLVREIAFPRQ